MKKKKLYKIWCEYDMGWENKVFSTKALAMKAIKEADWNSVEENDHKGLMEDGLLGIEEVTLD